MRAQLMAVVLLLSSFSSVAHALEDRVTEMKIRELIGTLRRTPNVQYRMHAVENFKEFLFNRLDEVGADESPAARNTMIELAELDSTLGLIQLRIVEPAGCTANQNRIIASQPPIEGGGGGTPNLTPAASAAISVLRAICQQ